MSTKLSAAIFAASLVGSAIADHSDCGSGRIHIDVRTPDDQTYGPGYCTASAGCTWNVRM